MQCDSICNGTRKTIKNLKTKRNLPFSTIIRPAFNKQLGSLTFGHVT